MPQNFSHDLSRLFDWQKPPIGAALGLFYGACNSGLQGMAWLVPGG
jgi:hypothetical protein